MGPSAQDAPADIQLRSLAKPLSSQRRASVDDGFDRYVSRPDRDVWQRSAHEKDRLIEKGKKQVAQAETRKKSLQRPISSIDTRVPKEVEVVPSCTANKQVAAVVDDEDDEDDVMFFSSKTKSKVTYRLGDQSNEVIVMPSSNSDGAGGEDDDAERRALAFYSRSAGKAIGDVVAGILFHF